MDSIDISDLAFSLSNLSPVNEVVSSTTETITDIVKDTIPEFIPNDIMSNDIMPSINEEVITNNFVPETFEVDDNFYMYLRVGLIVIALLGFFIYSYYTNKNKQVRFQENIEYYNQEPMYQRYEF